MALSAYRTNGFAFPLRALAEAEAVELCGRHLHSIASTMHQPERVNPHLLWPWVDRICRSAPLLDAVARVLESDQILLSPIFDFLIPNYGLFLYHLAGLP